MIRNYEITALETLTDHNYSKTPVEVIRHTKISLDGIGDKMTKKDTIYLHVPYTTALRIGQVMEVNFHCEELANAPALVPPCDGIVGPPL